MSSINVTNIKSRQGGAPTFPQGLNVSAGVATFASNVSIAGTLTYDDVTNIDSVGLITAQGGINVSAGNVKVNAGIVTVGAGVTISSDFIHLGDNKKIQLGIASDLEIYHDGSNSIINDAGTGNLRLARGGTTKVEVIGTGVSVYGGLRLQGGGLMRENVKISSTALNSDKVINLSEGMIHYRSSAVGGANLKLNVISSAGINTDLAIGDAMTVTVMTAAGSASHFVDQIRIDGVEASAGVTTSWVGGAVPTAGGTSGVDTYAFNVLKTGNATYVVVANQVKTS
tara:strand:- start:640 stop:1491 length:852 start_codon:yes stop_codon:yes gene_type:complete